MKEFKSLKEHVYDYIAEQIHEGKLLPSQRINETAISQELSVSRTPVREALIQLSCEDILENLPRKGFLLKPVTEKEAIDLYQLIGHLDGMAAKNSCLRLDEKDLDRMSFYIESMNLAISTNNYEMYFEQQELFHNTYIDKCNNQILIDTISRLKSKFFKRGIRSNNREYNYNLLYSINEEHRKILKLFKEKDSEELFLYLTNIHWSPEHAHNEIIE